MAKRVGLRLRQLLFLSAYGCSASVSPREVRDIGIDQAENLRLKTDSSRKYELPMIFHASIDFVLRGTK